MDDSHLELDAVHFSGYLNPQAAGCGLWVVLGSQATGHWAPYRSQKCSCSTLKH